MTRFFQTDFKKPVKTNRWRQFNLDRLVTFKNLFIFNVVCILVIGGYYVIETNNLVVKSYRTEELEQQLKTLVEANKKLELQATELQSVESIKARLSSTPLVNVENVEYLSSNDSVEVAVKR